MRHSDFCGKQKSSFKTYSVKVGKLINSKLVEQNVWGDKKYELRYTNVEWIRFHVCTACRWKRGLLYPIILALVISIIFSIIMWIIERDSILLGFTLFPGFLILGWFIFRTAGAVQGKALRRVRKINKNYAILKFEKS